MEKGKLRPATVLAVVLLLCATIVQLGLLYVNKIFLDDGLIAKNVRTIVLAGVALIVLGLVYVFFSWLGFYVPEAIGERRLDHLRRFLFEKMERVASSVWRERNGGYFSAVILKDTLNQYQLMAKVRINRLTSAITLSVIFVYAFWTCWEMALILIPTLALVLGIYLYIGKKLMYYSPLYAQNYGALSSEVVETVDAMEVIRSYGAEKTRGARFANLVRSYHQARYGMDLWLGLMDNGISIAVYLYLFATIVLGGYLLVQGRVTAGEIQIFIGLINFVLNPLMSLIQSLLERHNASGSVKNLEDYCLLPEEQSGKRPFVFDRSWAFENVAMRYGDVDVIKDLSFVLRPGESVLIQGASGSGKSTLIRLLMKFYAPSAGKITVDGVDFEEIDSVSLRDQVIYVPQESALFNRSIRENLALASRPELADSYMERLDLLTDMAQFENGQDHSVGAGGERLSGGQRQRLAMAIAAAKDAKIIIMDEPTSAVDLNTQENILSQMREWQKDKTLIVISHRDLDLHFDQIIRLGGQE